MIQDILPKKLWNEFEEKTPSKSSRCFVFRDRTVLIKKDAGKILLPLYGELEKLADTYIYLFRIDETEYYLLNLKGTIPNGYEFVKVQIFRKLDTKEVAFAGMTAFHLYVWYRDNKYCGRCGAHVIADKKERMLFCPECHNMIYPKIAPAVIVAVTDKNRLLMTKYSGREYTGYALIAGFTEIGETAEQTVYREVLEEVGIKVKNIRYYKSQPWGMDSDLLLGFFAELDGEDTISMDTHELSVAQWYQRQEITVSADDVSLTNEMIQAFLKQ